MPLHPFLISFYAVLSLYSENMNEIFINSIGRLLIVLILCTAIFLTLFYGLTKDLQKSGLLLSFFLLLFFTYGHVHNFKEAAIAGVQIFRHKYLIVIWLMLGITGAIFIVRTKKLTSFTSFANTMSVLMLLFPVFNIGRFVIEENVYNSVAGAQTSPPSELSLPQPAPDVYFIVMDAYGRADVLQDLFGFDNSEFVRELQGLGFYVVQCS